MSGVGSRNEPKFSHLGDLHRAIASVAPELLAQQGPITVPLTAVGETPTLEVGGATHAAVDSNAKCNAAGILSWETHPGACSGLRYDKKAADQHDCAIACCEDAGCEIWQFDKAQDNGCWRGKPTACQTTPVKAASGVRPGAKLPPARPGPAHKTALSASVFNAR